MILGARSTNEDAVIRRIDRLRNTHSIIHSSLAVHTPMFVGSIFTSNDALCHY
jgi:hypothetical protein